MMFTPSSAMVMAPTGNATLCGMARHSTEHWFRMVKSRFSGHTCRSQQVRPQHALMGIMQQREELVASEIEAAEKARKESHQFLEEQKSLLKEARTEAQSIVEGAKKQGELQKDEILTAARNEANRLKESALREIESEKEKAIAAVRDEVVSLSVLAASKVLSKEISEADNRALIEETIAKAGEAR